MSWLKSLNPFKKKEPAESSSAEAPQGLPKEAEGVPKGLMGAFYRKWKDPAFLKQIKILAAHMAKDGIDVKDSGQVKAWLEKNKEAIESGRLGEFPAEGKPQTYIKTAPEVGRNEPCPCGSGKKFKKCCGAAATRPGDPRERP